MVVMRKRVFGMMEKKKNKEEKIRGRVNISNSAKAFLGLGKRGKRKAI